MTDTARLSSPPLERPKLHPVRLLVAWILSAGALLFAAWALPGLAIEGFGGALLAALLIAILNAVLP
ncbi:MAG TPA: phage holin family protein, partial [Gaiellaceae bacterium]|nr:phage holin family protein [Gaiellaceae bacterium]